jgi:hypothetical protein
MFSRSSAVRVGVYRKQPYLAVVATVTVDRFAEQPIGNRQLWTANPDMTEIIEGSYILGSKMLCELAIQLVRSEPCDTRRALLTWSAVVALDLTQTWNVFTAPRVIGVTVKRARHWCDALRSVNQIVEAAELTRWTATWAS